jgi:ribosomal protein L7Ae-like RNA K-turn-binding protein
MKAAAVQRILRLAGLGVRGRGAVVGVQQVRDAARKGDLAFALVAPDASTNSLDKVLPILEARRIGYIRIGTAAELGAAVGRETTTAIGILDRQLARGIRDAIAESTAEPREEGV